MTHTLLILVKHENGLRFVWTYQPDEIFQNTITTSWWVMVLRNRFRNIIISRNDVVIGIVIGEWWLTARQRNLTSSAPTASIRISQNLCKYVYKIFIFLLQNFKFLLKISKILNYKNRFFDYFKSYGQSTYRYKCQRSEVLLNSTNTRWKDFHLIAPKVL